MKVTQWEGFVPGVWQDTIDVRDFIQRNYTPYEGDGAFLAGREPHARPGEKRRAGVLEFRGQALLPLL